MKANTVIKKNAKMDVFSYEVIQQANGEAVVIYEYDKTIDVVLGGTQGQNRIVVYTDEPFASGTRVSNIVDRNGTEVELNNINAAYMVVKGVEPMVDFLGLVNSYKLTIGFA